MAIILLPNYCTMLYYVFSGPLSLPAYVPEIKFNKKIKKCVHDSRNVMWLTNVILVALAAKPLFTGWSLE